MGADNIPSPPLFEAPAEPGTALQTTLDLRVQSQAEAVLPAEPGAALVAVQPSTGNVLAVANGSRTARAPRPPCWVNTPWAVRSSRSPNWPGCVPLRPGQERKTAAFRRTGLAAQSLGLGVAAGLGTQAFYGGVPDGSDDAAAAAAVDGPGTVLASPFAAAAAAASVARGERVSPVLVLNPADRAGFRERGNGVSRAAAGCRTDAPALTPDEAEELRSALRANVAGGRADEAPSGAGAP